jgi:hypothetical protein
VLAQRDAVATSAAALGLAPDGALRSAYESAQESFDAADGIANDQLTALAALATAKLNVEATPDLLAQLGLIGETPRGPYEAARRAFEAGELDDATAQAGAASALVAGAAAIGQRRLIVGVAAAATLLLVLIVAVLLLRRRGRRRELALATAGAATLPAADAEHGEPYATLAADPAAAPAQALIAPSAPDDQGAEPL